MTSTMLPEVDGPLTARELAAAFRFIAREHPTAVEALLFGLCNAEDLVAVCRANEPDVHAYTEVAAIDDLVSAVLTASAAGREVLSAGLHSATPAVRHRINAARQGGASS